MLRPERVRVLLEACEAFEAAEPWSGTASPEAELASLLRADLPIVQGNRGV